MRSPVLGSNLRREAQPELQQSLLARHEALFRVSRAINVYRDPKELFKVLAIELRHIVDFDFIRVSLYDEAANKLHNVVLETLAGPGFGIPVDFPAEETITGAKAMLADGFLKKFPKPDVAVALRGRDCGELAVRCPAGSGTP